MFMHTSNNIHIQLFIDNNFDYRLTKCKKREFGEGIKLLKLNEPIFTSAAPLAC